MVRLRSAIEILFLNRKSVKLKVVTENKKDVLVVSKFVLSRGVK